MHMCVRMKAYVCIQRPKEGVKYPLLSPIISSAEAGSLPESGVHILGRLEASMSQQSLCLLPTKGVAFGGTPSGLSDGC